jgi:mono/diheme cytochrome c family protein
LLALVIVLAIAGCEGARNNSSWSTAKPGDPIIPTLASTKKAPGDAASETSTTTAATGAASDRGIGPVDHVDISKLDGARALAGSQLFTIKCSACHKIEERYIGPALAGVTRRRTPEWILNMILNPEIMIQKDPTAKALLAEYIAPMANQHLTRDEAENILAYFLQHDGAGTAPVEGKAAGTAPTATQH